MRNQGFQQSPLAARFLLSVFGLVFLGAGLTVLGFLWFGDDGFGAPPLVFKLFGSFIAIAFVAMGGSMAASAILGKGMLPPAPPVPRTATRDDATGAAGAGYACPHCGGALGEKAEVSPMGDVKCAFCGRWFNVHGRS